MQRGLPPWTALQAAEALDDADEVRRAIRNSIRARGFGFEDLSWLSASARAIRPTIKSCLGMRCALRTAASAASGRMPSVRAAWKPLVLAGRSRASINLRYIQASTPTRPIGSSPARKKFLINSRGAALLRVADIFVSVDVFRHLRG